MTGSVVFGCASSAPRAPCEQRLNAILFLDKHGDSPYNIYNGLIFNKLNENPHDRPLPSDNHDIPSLRIARPLIRFENRTHKSRGAFALWLCREAGGAGRLCRSFVYRRNPKRGRVYAHSECKIVYHRGIGKSFTNWKHLFCIQPFSAAGEAWKRRCKTDALFVYPFIGCVCAARKPLCPTASERRDRVLPPGPFVSCRSVRIPQDPSRFTLNQKRR